MINRTAYQELLQWKVKTGRKPLVLQGARQVGKTWLIKQFGQTEYQQFLYFNFEEASDLAELFENNLSAEQMITKLSIYSNQPIRAENTLIFFDEIQLAPRAITSLKYFFEQAPEYHIIAAGSLLGVQVGKQSAFPVGKVNFMTLYPLHFHEYLGAVHEDLLLEYLLNINIEHKPEEIFHQKLLGHLKTFLYLGGMPEVVQHYIRNKEIVDARKIQLDILDAYSKDFSKYTNPNQSIKTSEVWQSIPYQLAKENKKFKYSDVRKKARASTYELTIEWLRNAGLIHLIHLIRTPKLPLAGYADYQKFKIYTLDTGMLAAMLDLHPSVILNTEQLFLAYNGAFTENFVANELIKSGQNKLYYWTSKSDAEVDYLIQNKQSIIPIEVKSGSNKNLKSLKSYIDKYNPNLAIRISPRNFHKSGNFVNLPIYATYNLPNILKQL